MIAKIITAAAMAIVISAAGPATAQDSYPSKTVRVIIPIPGGPDAAMRAIVAGVEKRLGQSWVVDNRPGASLTIGAQACAVAKPDGHTLCILASDNLTVQPHVFKSLPYDPETAFKPIGLMYYNVDGLVASNGLKSKSVKELAAYAKANPGKVNFGTIGPGTTSDMFRLWVQREWDAEITPIPYKGGALVGKALMASEVDISRLGLVSFAGPIKGGLVKVLAVGANERQKALPDVPTFKEAGIGFPIKVWWSLFAPAGTPDAIVNKINAALNESLQDQDTRDRMESLYLVPAGGSPADLAATIKTDSASTADIVKSFGIEKR